METKSRCSENCNCNTCNQGDARSYQRTQMQKDMVLERLREKGCRITKQRLMLLDIILEEECACCKEIYYLASLRDKNIGTATIYRMINMLEEIGAISRKNMYKISCDDEHPSRGICSITLEDGTVLEIPARDLNDIIAKGLKESGYTQGTRVMEVVAEGL